MKQCQFFHADFWEKNSKTATIDIKKTNFEIAGATELLESSTILKEGKQQIDLSQSIERFFEVFGN